MSAKKLSIEPSEFINKENPLKVASINASPKLLNIFPIEPIFEARLCV